MSSRKRWSATRHGRWATALLGSAVISCVVGGCSPLNTCCPPGPPYLPVCSEGFYYYHHGNQLQPSPSAAQMLTQSPWRHMGRVARQPVFEGGGTGVLIHPNFVLTAAHVVMSDFDEFPQDPPVFFLAQPCPGCLPYGYESVDRVWVPQEWIDNVGGSYDSMETRAYDWAILEVDLPESLWSGGVPDPLPMPIIDMPFGQYDHLLPRAAGYGCGKQADGSVRREAKPYATGDDGDFLSREIFPTTDDGAGGGSLIRTTLEAVGGMSGGPVWIEHGEQNQLVGLMIGSPQEACAGGVNWVAGMSPNTRQRILQVINLGSAPGMVSSGSFSGGEDGSVECPSLPGGPCPIGDVGVGGDAGCGNPEER